MEFSADQIAQLVGGEIDGDSSIKMDGITKIEGGAVGSLAFLSNPAYEKHIYDTKASVVLVNKDFVPEKKLSCTLIRVDDARVALITILRYYEQLRHPKKKPGVEQPSFISTSASIGEDVYIGAFTYIGENASIGSNVEIHPHAYIGDNVKVGDSTVIHSGVKVYADCNIGKSCILHSGAVIGADGFGFIQDNDGVSIKIPQIGNVVLEDFVEIGANSTIDCATMGSTTIKEGVKLDNLVHIAHNAKIGNHTVIAAQSGIAGSSEVGRKCFFGGQVGVVGHITVGDDVKVGAKTGVISNKESGSVLFGTPAINHRAFMKSYSIFRNLPKFYDGLIEVERIAKKTKGK